MATNPTTVPPNPRLVLDLDELVGRRRLVRIGGVDYELMSPDELSVTDFHRIGRAWKAASDVLNAENASSDQVKEAQAELDVTCRVILLAPADVHARLSDLARLRIGLAFISAPAPTAPTTGQETAAPASVEAPPEPKTEPTA